MHQIHKMNCEKNPFETNADIDMALMQIRSTLLGPKLPSLATLLFNTCKRLTAKDQQAPNIQSQPHANVDTDTCDFFLFPTGSTEVVKCDYGRP